MSGRLVFEGIKVVVMRAVIESIFGTVALEPNVCLARILQLDSRQPSDSVNIEFFEALWIPSLDVALNGANVVSFSPQKIRSFLFNVLG